MGVRVPPFACNGENFRNRAIYETKKRDPRFLKEEERTTASRRARHYEGPAAAASRAAGESCKTPCYFDEIRTERIVAGGAGDDGESRRQVDLAINLEVTQNPCLSFIRQGFLASAVAPIKRCSD